MSYISWDPIPPALAEDWNGFSLIVDDVERFVGTALNYTLASLDWNVEHFFRLAVSALLVVAYLLVLTACPSILVCNVVSERWHKWRLYTSRYDLS